MFTYSQLTTSGTFTREKKQTTRTTKQTKKNTEETKQKQQQQKILILINMYHLCCHVLFPVLSCYSSKIILRHNRLGSHVITVKGHGQMFISKNENT
jgi:hypothetical protein